MPDMNLNHNRDFRVKWEGKYMNLGSREKRVLSVLNHEERLKGKIKKGKEIILFDFIPLLLTRTLIITQLFCNH